MPELIPPVPPSPSPPTGLNDPAAALESLLSRLPSGAVLDGQVREILGPNRYLVSLFGQVVELQVPATLSPLQQFALKVVEGASGSPALALLATSPATTEGVVLEPLPAAILAPSLIDALPAPSDAARAASADITARTEAVLQRFGLASTPENFAPVSAALRSPAPDAPPEVRAAATAYLLSRHLAPQPALVAAVAALTADPGAFGPLVDRLQSLAASLSEIVGDTGPAEGPARDPLVPGTPAAVEPPGTSPSASPRPFPSLVPPLPSLLPVGEVADPRAVSQSVEAATAPLPIPQPADAEPILRSVFESSPRLRAIDLALAALGRIAAEDGGLTSTASTSAAAGPQEAVEIARLVGLLERIAAGSAESISASVDSEFVPALRTATAAVREGLRRTIEAVEARAIREHPVMQAVQAALRDGGAAAERMAALRLTSGLDTVRGEPTLRIEIPLVLDGRPATALLEVRDREAGGGGRRESPPAAANVFLALEFSQIGWVTVQVDGEKKTATARFRVRDARVRRLLWKHRRDLTEAVGRIGIALNMDVAVQTAGESMPAWGPAAERGEKPAPGGVDLRA